MAGWAEVIQGTRLLAILPGKVVPTLELLVTIELAASAKGKPLSENEVLALMESPSQAVH